MMVSIKRGALIVIEGMDRCGKSTQCKKLVASLNENNIKAELMSFPDRTTSIGKVINEFLSRPDYTLNDKAIHLLFSANRWECFDKIKKTLNDGVTLIVDRYSYSGIVFSAFKQNMDITWCKSPERGLPKPDKVFLLTLTLEQLKERPGFGNERYENVLVQKQVADLFWQMSKSEDNWVVVDASKSIEDVHEKLLKESSSTIEKVKTLPIKYLDFSS